MTDDRIVTVRDVLHALGREAESDTGDWPIEVVMIHDGGAWPLATRLARVELDTQARVLRLLDA